LRITLDREVSFYPPPADLWERSVALTRTTLGGPRCTLDGCILEVKARQALPEWLLALVSSTAPTPTHVSKFVLASKALYA
jgi:hypothetical protein